MHRPHADDRRSGSLHEAGTSAKGRICQPPSPPWEPMNSSNGATSLRLGVVEQLTRMSGQWGKPSVRRRWSAALGAEVPQRVLSRDPVVREVAAARGAEHDRAVAVGADHHEADAGVLDERSDQARVQALDLADGHPVLRARSGRSARARPRPARSAAWSEAVCARAAQRPRGWGRARRRRRPGDRGSRGRASAAGAVLVAGVGERAADGAEALVGRRRREDRRPLSASRPAPRARSRSAGGTGGPGLWPWSERTTRWYGRGACSMARSSRASWASCWRSTANASGSSIPEWWATSS